MMKHTMKLFRIGLRQIISDGMLLIMLPAPILVGFFFKYAIPFINEILMKNLSFSLSPWYGLMDAILLCLTPMLIGTLSAFLLLDERDEGLGAYYQITPASGYPYLTARIGIPMLWACMVSILVSVVFHSTPISFEVILMCSFISCATGMCFAMMISTMAGNRVEGIAFSKVAGLSFIGLFMVWFVPAPYQYIGSILPSFWIGKLLMEGPNIIVLFIGLGISFLWIALFTSKFLRRTC